MDCNSCGCHNRAIHCTHIQCAKSEVVDSCQECTNEPDNQVCGTNGVTYSSPCAAMHCAGLASTEYVQGSCADVVRTLLHYFVAPRVNIVACYNLTNLLASVCRCKKYPFDMLAKITPCIFSYRSKFQEQIMIHLYYGYYF